MAPIHGFAVVKMQEAIALRAELKRLSGDSVAGPFNDASQDLLDLHLTRLGQTNYQASVRRIVTTPGRHEVAAAMAQASP